MTKDQEIRKFDEFIAGLPDASYLKPWLAGIRDNVEAAIRRDIIPELTPLETYRQCMETRNEAARAIRDDLRRKRNELERMRLAHEKDCKRITDEAEKECECVRAALRLDIQRLRSAITNF